MSDGFAGFVTMKVQADKVDQFRALAIEVADAMSKEKGFERASVHTFADDPTTFFIYEAWSCSYDHFVAEIRNRSYRLKFNELIDSMSSEDRKVALLNNVASYSG